ncbi:PQQ-binding-like beta-propeller repeat protein [Brevifollis gellanilyticus]|uniref:Alcohol dehydrogenase n=1 Tax=Brevifollis gellanilyticus TaxID=748831 RepID=A0A512MIB4_9BACT|nr:PQQ-binding-like beta-propeller repeat protein [Brevifollis gellanilyticus]GEP46472.1 alcohol dehydrogenase [Brevifollis gellanilyticus]
MTSRRSLPWFPILIVVLTAIALVAVGMREEMERNFKGWLMSAIPLLASILLFLWFLITPRFSWKTRLIGLFLVIATGVAAKQLVRVDGVIDGRGLPRFAWRWSTKAQPATAPLKVDDPNTTAPKDDPRLASAADVPQFFGPNRDGLAPEIKLATDWTATPPKELWRQPIGPAWSAYAVVGGRAITQEQRGEDEAVTCYELLTGRLLWAHVDKAHFSQWQGGEGPRGTPMVDKDRVYTFGATGILNCLDLATGKPHWQRRILDENKLANIEWGLSASPLVVNDLVIVSSGRPNGDAQPPLLLAFKIADGTDAWRSGEGEASYSSPMLATLAGKQVILYQGARGLTAHDPATGSILLTHPWGDEKWPRASQPVVVPGDRVFLSAGYGMGCCMLQIKAEADGKLTATELWASLKMKTQFNSTALKDNHLYGLDDGRLTCLDLATGDRLWKEGRFASGQTLLAGDLVIVQSEPGPVHLCAADPAGFKELGKLAALDAKTWNHPVLAGRYLLVRNDREAVCYELPVK